MKGGSKCSLTLKSDGLKIWPVYGDGERDELQTQSTRQIRLLFKSHPATYNCQYAFHGLIKTETILCGRFFIGNHIFLRRNQFSKYDPYASPHCNCTAFVPQET